ncbi:hypothetical protein ACLOJK_014794 [Asimina triloba]
MMGQIVWLDKMDFGMAMKTLPLIKLLGFLRIMGWTYRCFAHCYLDHCRPLLDPCLPGSVLTACSAQWVAVEDEEDIPTPCSLFPLSVMEKTKWKNARPIRESTPMLYRVAVEPNL